MQRKIVAVWISLAIVLGFIVIIIEIAPIVEAPTVIYVDDIPGSGPGNPAENYTNINTAISNANHGDTVFVYSGTYNESITVDKRINLTGENRETTIIDRGGVNFVLQITSDWVNITGFSFFNKGGTDPAIIFSTLSNIRIIGNKMIDCSQGVFIMDFCSYITISNNIIIRSLGSGIYVNGILESSVISNNFLISNGPNAGIFIPSGSDNLDINGNYIINNWYGLAFKGTNNNITNNIFLNNYDGIVLQGSSGNRIYHNDIIGNNNQADDDSNNGNQWDNGYPSGGNYWSDYTGIDLYSTPAQNVPPPDEIGDTPYVIDSNSRDNYPSMIPFGNFTILPEGWNLISFPLIPPETKLDTVLSVIDGDYNAVQWYDNTDSSDLWKHNHISKPAQLNDLKDLNHTQGFWINITKSGGAYFYFIGIQPSINQSISLYPGWNLVGYPSLTSNNRTDGLNNLTFGIHVDVIQWFNATSKTWHFMGLSDNFVPGRGYWVHSKVDAEWEVPL